MNKLTYISILIVGALMFASCNEGTTTFVSNVQDGPNLASFSATSMSVEKVADPDTTYTIEVPMKMEGPSLNALSGDITVNIEAVEIPDADNPAKEGTHFTLETSEVTLTKSNSYVGNATVTMLTAAITDPANAEPMAFELKATGVSGGGDIVASAKPIEVTFNYACPSMLGGTYDVVVSKMENNVVTDTYNYNDVEITKDKELGLGTYVAGSVAIGEYGPGEVYEDEEAEEKEGLLIFTDDCGTLTVPSQNLALPKTEDGEVVADVREVKDTEDGEVTGNSQTGALTSFTLRYSIERVGNYTAVYTKQ